MDITQDTSAMLEAGDWDKLDKREREAFHAMQERMTQFLIQESNHYQLQFPGLHVVFRFQAEVHKSVLNNPSTIRYSGQVY
jgi:hypothetical protein